MGKRPLALLVFSLVGLVWVPLVLMAGEGLSWSPVRRTDGSATRVSGLTLAAEDPRLGQALHASSVVALWAATLATVVVMGNVCVLRLTAARTASPKVTPPAARLAALAAVLVPELALALGVALLLSWTGLGRSMPGLILAHCLLGCLVGMPLAFALTERISLATEMAALDLGCSPLQTALRVTFPEHWRPTFSVFLLTALLSFEDFVVALFVAPSGVTTLPLYIFSLIRFRRLAEANALGFLLTLLAMAAVLAVTRIINVNVARVRRDDEEGKGK